MCASNIEKFVEPCGVTLNVLKNSAHRKRVCTVCLVDRFSLPPTCFLMSVSLSQLPILLTDRLARQKMILYCRYCNLVESFFALSFCAWSHLNCRGTPLLEMNRCINLKAKSAVVFVTTFAVGKFDHLSIATKIYASLFSLSGRDLGKSD